MGKPAVGRQKGQAAGGSHDLVGTRERSRGTTTPTAREVAGQGRTTVGRQGAPCLRSRVRHRSLALAALPLPRALCGAALQKGNKLLDDAGRERKAWEIARGQRSWGTEAKLLGETQFRVYRRTRVLALPVRHPEYQGRLWLVVVREAQRTRAVVFAHQ